MSNEYLAELSCGTLVLRRNGEDVHLRGVPDGEPVFQVCFDAPENGCHLTMEDVRTLTLLRELKTLPPPFGVAKADV